MNGFDIIIIGGGVLGAVSAYYLSKEGYKVAVFEKGDLASGASGANLGQISITDRDAPWHLQLVLEALDIYKEVSGCCDIEFRQTGGIVTLTDTDQLYSAKERAENLKKAGVKIDIITGKDIKKIEPHLDYTTVEAVAYCGLEGIINPFVTTLWFYESAKKAGAKVFSQAPVEAFIIGYDRINKIVTKQGQFTADVFINTAGSWAGKIAEMAGTKIPIRYHRGTAFVSQPVSKLLNCVVTEGGFFIKARKGDEKRHIGAGIAQGVNGSLLLAQATEESALDDKAITPQGLCLTAKKILQQFPVFSGVEIVRAWAGLTPYTPDGLPIFGFCGRIKNLFTAAAFKGAFSTAPAIGKKVASAVKNGEIWENNAFSPDR